MKKNINPLIQNVKRVVERHKLAPGAFARYTMDNGTGRKMGVNESMVHEDFMIGTEDLSIIGETETGEKIEIFSRGNWSELFK